MAEYFSFVGDFLPSKEVHFSLGETPHLLIGNFECTLAQGKALKAKAYPVAVNPETLMAVGLSGFSALNVANNHTYDAGENNFKEMLAFFRSVFPTIQIYGLRGNPFAVFTINSLRCAVIGCQEFCLSRGPGLFKQEQVKHLINEIRPDFEKVYVTPHWGKYSEFAFHPSPGQRRLARAWVAAGADGIFGCHTHTVNGFEVIDSRPCFYSLGNFLFNHFESQKYPLTKHSLMVSLRPEKMPGSDIVDFNIIRHSVSEVRLMTKRSSKPLLEFIERISEEIAQPPKLVDYLAWARLVGPTYIHKSLLSWKQRLRSQPSYKVIPKWLLWSFLPINLLLFWGSMTGGHKSFHQARQIEEELKAQYSNNFIN